MWENAAKSCKYIWEVHGGAAVDESAVRRWFGKCKAGEFSLEHDSCNGKLSMMFWRQKSKKMEISRLGELKVSKNVVHEH